MKKTSFMPFYLLLIIGIVIVLFHQFILTGNFFDSSEICNHESLILFLIGIIIGIFVRDNLK